MKAPLSRTAKLFLATAILLIVSIGITYLVGFVALRSIRKIDDQRSILISLEQVITTLDDAETGQRGYLLTGLENYLEPYRSALAQMRNRQEELRRLVKTGDLPSQRVETLNKLIEDKLAELDQTIRLRRDQGLEAALAIVRSGQGKTVMDKIRAEVAGLSAGEQQELNEAVRSANVAVNARSLTFLIMGLLNLGFLGWAYRQIRREMRQREAAEEELTSVAQFPEENPHPVLRLGSAGQVLYVNGSARQFLMDQGWEPGQAAPSAFWEKVRPALQSGQENQFEFSCSPGSILSFLCVSIAHRGYTNLYGRDITDRKQAEEALREAEAREKVAQAVRAERQRFNDVFETLPAMICLLTPDYHVAFANRSFRERFGEAHGRHCYEYCFGRSEPCDFCESYNVLKTGKPHHWEVKGADGSVIDAYDYPFTDADGSPMILEMDIDITEMRKAQAALKEANETLEGRVAERTAELEAEVAERNRAEEELRRNETLLRAVTDNSPDPIFLKDRDSRMLLANPATLAVLGKRAEQVLGKTDEEFYADPEAGRRMMANDRRVMEAGQTEVVEEVVPGPQGPRTFLSSKTPYRDAEGGVIGVIGIARDITERKQAEEKLRESHERLKRVLEVEAVGVMFWDLATGRLVDANAAFLKLMGYSRKDLETQALTWQKFTPPEYHDVSLAEIRKFQATGRVGPYEKEYFRKDGTRQWLLFSGSSLGNNSCVEFCIDISARKQAEAALRENERQFRTLADTIPNLAWWANGDGYITWYNRRWYEYTGTTPEQMEGWGWQSVHDPQVLPKVLERWKASIATGEPFDMEFPLRGADGQFRLFLTRVQPVKDPQGRVARWFGTNTDVDELKRTEEALRKAEGLMKADLAALTRMHALSGRLLEEGGLQPLLEEVMDAAAAIMGAERGTLQLLEGDSLRIVAHHNHQKPFLEFFAAAESRASVCGEATKRAERVIVPDIEKSPLFANTPSLAVLREASVRAVQSTPMVSRKGALLGILTTQWSAPYSPDQNDLWRLDLLVRQAADLIEYAQSEERLKLSLREKEVMLKEIHHRVKNNLQVIASLVDLQTNAMADPALKGRFQDVRDRVRSMALVHEKLYQSESLARVEFADYARSLLSYLSRSHGSRECPIELKMDLNPVSLSVENAVPCGLILNELVTNAIKHAFRGRASGEIAVALGSGPDGRAFLRVRDNGAGLPAGMNWPQSRSMGLRLVQLLAGQLGAAVEVSTDGGTQFKITFQPEKPEVKD